MLYGDCRALVALGLVQSTMIVWANPTVDISDEVVKRLDARADQN